MMKVVDLQRALGKFPVGYPHPVLVTFRELCEELASEKDSDKELDDFELIKQLVQARIPIINRSNLRIPTSVSASADFEDMDLIRNMPLNPVNRLSQSPSSPSPLLDLSVGHSSPSVSPPPSNYSCDDLSVLPPSPAARFLPIAEDLPTSRSTQVSSSSSSSPVSWTSRSPSSSLLRLRVTPTTPINISELYLDILQKDGVNLDKLLTGLDWLVKSGQECFCRETFDAVRNNPSPDKIGNTLWRLTTQNINCVDATNLHAITQHCSPDEFANLLIKLNLNTDTAGRNYSPDGLFASISDIVTKPQQWSIFMEIIEMLENGECLTQQNVDHLLNQSYRWLYGEQATTSIWAPLQWMFQVLYNETGMVAQISQEFFSELLDAIHHQPEVNGISDLMPIDVIMNLTKKHFDFAISNIGVINLRTPVNSLCRAFR